MCSRFSLDKANQCVMSLGIQAEAEEQGGSQEYHVEEGGGDQTLRYLGEYLQKAINLLNEVDSTVLPKEVM